MPRKKRELSFDELLESIPKMTKRQRQQVITKIIRENGYADNRTKKFINYDLQEHMRKEGFGKPHFFNETGTRIKIPPIKAQTAENKNVCVRFISYLF